jgi:hypothetical protein
MIEVTLLRVAFRSFASTLAVVCGVREPRFYQFAMNRAKDHSVSSPFGES